MSGLCITARVIPRMICSVPSGRGPAYSRPMRWGLIPCMMSGVLCVDKWMTESMYTNWSTTATGWPWTVMVGCTFTPVPKAWTFVFCQLTSNPSEVTFCICLTDLLFQNDSRLGQVPKEKVKGKAAILRKLSHEMTDISLSQAEPFALHYPRCWNGRHSDTTWTVTLSSLNF